MGFITKKPNKTVIMNIRNNSKNNIVKKDAIIKENNDNKNNNIVMTTQEKINAIDNALSMPSKRIKKDKGLIERTESSVTILTEDNKELLKD